MPDRIVGAATPGDTGNDHVAVPAAVVQTTGRYKAITRSNGHVVVPATAIVCRCARQPHDSKPSDAQSGNSDPGELPPEPRSGALAIDSKTLNHVTLL